MTAPVPPHAGFRPFAKSAERAFTPTDRRADTKSALVVLDTNVLLEPYRASEAALGAIKDTLQPLRAAKRLLVPAQVAREFAKNRLDVIADLHKQVLDQRTMGLQGSYDPPPVLHHCEEHDTASKALAQAREALKGYRGALEKLAIRIEGWALRDPVLDVYGALFDSSVVRELSLTAEEIEAIRKQRYDARLPPGFKDKAKPDGGVGDLVVWLTVLEEVGKAPRDVILVTNDSKDDWFHTSDDKKPVFPRYELVEEFAEATGGKALSLVTLSSFLEAFGAKKEVVEEIRGQERGTTEGRRSWFFHQVGHRLTLAMRNMINPPAFPEFRILDEACRETEYAVGIAATGDPTQVVRAIRHAGNAVARGVAPRVTVACLCSSNEEVGDLRDIVTATAPEQVSVAAFLEQPPGELQLAWETRTPFHILTALSSPPGWPAPRE